MFTKKLGIIGIGKIGSTLLRGLINSGILDREKIIIYDINQDLLLTRKKEFDVDIANSNKDLIQEAKFILIAVLPQVIDKVLEEISSVMTDNHVIITIAAGISISHISRYFDKKLGIVRVMTNTPAMVKAAASAISPNEYIKQPELEFVKNISNIKSYLIRY